MLGQIMLIKPTLYHHPTQSKATPGMTRRQPTAKDFQHRGYPAGYQSQDLPQTRGEKKIKSDGSSARQVKPTTKHTGRPTKDSVGYLQGCSATTLSHTETKCARLDWLSNTQRDQHYYGMPHEDVLQ